MTNYKVFVVTSFLVVTGIGWGQMSVQAQEEETERVLGMVRSQIQTVLDILRNEELSSKEKKERIEQVTDPLFDHQLMAKLVLGRTHWPRLNSTQRERYVSLFKRVIKSSYIDKMGQVTKVNVEYEEPEQKGGDKIYIPTVMDFQDQDVEVEYRLYRQQPKSEEDTDVEDVWKIFDVKIKGVSLVKSYHSQYRDFLNDHSFDELLDKMKSKIEKNSEEPDEK